MLCQHSQCSSGEEERSCDSQWGSYSYKLELQEKPVVSTTDLQVYKYLVENTEWRQKAGLVSTIILMFWYNSMLVQLYQLVTVEGAGLSHDNLLLALTSSLHSTLCVYTPLLKSPGGEEMLIFDRTCNLQIKFLPDFLDWLQCPALDCVTMHALPLMRTCGGWAMNHTLAGGISFSTRKKRLSCLSHWLVLQHPISTLRENFQIRHQTSASNINPVIRDPENMPTIHSISTDKNFLSKSFSILSFYSCSFLFPTDICCLIGYK